MSILGTRVLRTEDPKLLTVGGSYVADLPFDDALHVVYVRSTAPHARITSIDTSEARQAPGVVDVVTAADITELPPAPEQAPVMPPTMRRPMLADGTVRFVGEPIAAVVAETREQAVDASELVFVDYEPLPPVIDPDAALAGEVLLFPAAGTNVANDMSSTFDPELFDGCDVVVRRRIVNQRLAPCPLEGRAGASQWSDGKLTHWGTTQIPHFIKKYLSDIYGTDEVRVIAPDVGGAFGAKKGNFAEEMLLPELARRVARPVHWVETRSENMVGLGHGRGQIQDLEIGGSRDGRIGAYRLTVLADAGAYPTMGSMLPFATRMMLTGVYDIPKAEFSSKSVVTNTTPTVAYRGAGRPEAAAAIERAVDLFAAEIGMDPAEVRRRNFIGPDRFPFTTPTGATYDIGDYEGALDKVLAAAGYAQLREEQERRREANDVKQIGIGLSVYVEMTAIYGTEFGSVEIHDDGTVTVLTGTSPHGQGHETAWAMLVADRLGVPIESIRVLHGDTDVIPRGEGTMGSRSLQLGGTAVHGAAEALLELAKERAGQQLEANAEDIVIDKERGVFHVAGTPSVSVSWAELAETSPLSAEYDFTATGGTYPFGAHVVVVEVDLETGRVEVVRLVAVDDAGRILNPLLADGQVHGGLAQGVAQALLEEFVYDADGNPLTTTFADYGVVSATELPSFEIVHMETPTPMNPLGAKGIGESGSVGATPAVQNAVVDALANLGVRHVPMPATPERVWRVIQEAR